VSQANISAGERPRFRNRVAVITGGGRGIGAACARRFAMEGATVVIADVDDAPVGEVLSEIQRQRGQAFGMRCDVTDPRSVDTLFRTVGKRLGQVDVLVACAGILRFNLVRDITQLEWDQFWTLTSKGASSAPRLLRR
jgi:3-oxoacyl-[acyl-carrier protein] reductase